MSATAIHGSKQSIQIEDPDNPGTYIDVSDKLTDASPGYDKDNVNTTTFTEGDKTNISGQRGAVFSVNGLMDQELRDLLWTIYLSDDPVSIIYGPEGDASGKEKQTADYHLTGFGDGGNVSGAVGTAPAFVRTGGTTRSTFS